jgi:hypothetical protein
MKFLTALILCLILYSNPVYTQGCSDAGACTIPALQLENPFEETPVKNSITIGFTAGAADHDIMAIGAHAAYSRKLGSSLSIDGKVTYAARNGNDINTNGFGDVYVSLNYRLSATLTATAGVKMPLSEGDRTLNGIMLPMDYQTSLGTPDLIVGLAYQKSNWLIALGYQQPVDQTQNRFYPSDWPAESPLSGFVQTGTYERQGDLLLRISRRIPTQGRMTFIPGILPIYHLGEDIDYTTFEKVKIKGSGGLTLNAVLAAEIDFGDGEMIRPSIGFPLVVREVRPDGLTRSVVAGIDYLIAF